MQDLLALTLAGARPEKIDGETEELRWRWLGEGALSLCPRRPYRRAVVLSAGIHGNETAPVELLNQLLDDVLHSRLPLAVRLLVLLGNPPALRAGQRYLHSDMNRMFGGRHRQFIGSDETARCAQLERITAEFFAVDDPAGGVERYHYDLHTAIRESHHPRFGLLPYQPRAYSAAMLAWLEAADLDALVVHRTPGGTFSHFSSEYLLAASCTLELGKARPFGENRLEQFTAIDRALRAWVSGAAPPARGAARLRFYTVERSLIKRSDSFRLYLSEDTANFSVFERGTLLMEQPEESYRVQHDREWILFPNPHVAVGLRAGLMLTELRADDLVRR